jgi:hypothetical protein
MTKEANGTTDLIVLGLNEDGKPVAARFPATQRDLVEKAAKAMNLTVHKAESAALAELASKLPTGRLYATGRGFVPPMRKDQYAKLVEQLNAAGQSVGGAQATQSATQPQSVASDQLPKTWDEVGSGHMVVAHEGPKEPWFVAVVVAREGDMLTLKWRDYPYEANVLRHVGSVALLKPGPVGA